MAAATWPGTSLLVCLLVVQAAVVHGRAIDAAETRSGHDSVLDAIFGRARHPSIKVRDTSLRENPFSRDFDSSAAQTGNEVGTGYVENSVGQRSKNMNSLLVVVPRHSARTSSRTAEVTSASRHMDSKGIEVQPLRALVSRNKTRNHRNIEEAIHSAEKFILDKMASSSSGGKTSNPSKNGSAQAFASPSMSRSRKERQPAAILQENAITRNVTVDLPNFHAFFEIHVVKCNDSSDSGTGGTEPFCREVTLKMRLKFTLSPAVVTNVLLIIIAVYIIRQCVLLVASQWLYPACDVDLASMSTGWSRQAGPAEAGTIKPCGPPETSSKWAEVISYHPEAIIS